LENAERAAGGRIARKAAKAQREERNMHERKMIVRPCIFFSSIFLSLRLGALA
jgi:hypothetical protein